MYITFPDSIFHSSPAHKTFPPRVLLEHKPSTKSYFLNVFFKIFLLLNLSYWALSLHYRPCFKQWQFFPPVFMSQILAGQEVFSALLMLPEHVPSVFPHLWILCCQTTAPITTVVEGTFQPHSLLLPWCFIIFAPGPLHSKIPPILTPRDFEILTDNPSNNLTPRFFSLLSSKTLPFTLLLTLKLF